MRKVLALLFIAVSTTFSALPETGILSDSKTGAQYDIDQLLSDGSVFVIFGQHAW